MERNVSVAARKWCLMIEKDFLCVRGNKKEISIGQQLGCLGEVGIETARSCSKLKPARAHHFFSFGDLGEQGLLGLRFGMI
jgi:hypothetical protein